MQRSEELSRAKRDHSLGVIFILAGCDNQFDVAAALEQVNHRHGVGNHHDFFIKETLSKRQRRGAAVDNDRVTIFHPFSRFLSNQVLIINHLYGFELKTGFHAGTACQIRAAVAGFHNALLFEEGEVAANSHFGDAKLLRQVIDHDLFVLLQNGIDAHSSV